MKKSKTIDEEPPKWRGRQAGAKVTTIRHSTSWSSNTSLETWFFEQRRQNNIVQLVGNLRQGSHPFWRSTFSIKCAIRWKNRLIHQMLMISPTNVNHSNVANALWRRERHLVMILMRKNQIFVYQVQVVPGHHHINTDALLQLLLC